MPCTSDQANAIIRQSAYRWSRLQYTATVPRLAIAERAEIAEYKLARFEADLWWFPREMLFSAHPWYRHS